MGYPKIFIIVEKGLVSEVYASRKNTSVEVIDLDCQDEEDEKLNKALVKRAEKQFKVY